jgi:hypothetical protein
MISNPRAAASAYTEAIADGIQDQVFTFFSRLSS